jgi:hypothetical protein
MHKWGDDWPHWDNLYKAIAEIIHIVTVYGRIGSHGKEKWGHFRDQLWMWDGTLTSLLYPGYVRIMSPRWFYWYVDQPIIRRILYYSGISRLIMLYQAVIFNYAIQRACKKYPEIIDELVRDLDWYRAVKPGIFGKVCGTTIHKKYWRAG